MEPATNPKRRKPHNLDKYTPAEIQQMRRERTEHALPYRAIAEHWGISTEKAYKIINAKYPYAQRYPLWQNIDKIEETLSGLSVDLLPFGNSRT